MQPETPEPDALVYEQDEAFVTAVGEPIPLEQVTRIVVATVDLLYADALCRVCAEAFRGAQVEWFRPDGATIAALRAAPADFLVLGLAVAETHEVALLQSVARERLARRVVVVSGRKDEHSLQALRAARFDGFFDPLEEKLDALLGALRQVAEGRGYLSPSLCQRMFAQRSAGVLVPRLTPAELQVFAVIGDGSDDGEAAAVLGLSDATVATHRRNIMRKLDVPSSAKLVREAVRLGVVRISPDGEVTRPGFDSALGGRRARPG